MFGDAEKQAMAVRKQAVESQASLRTALGGLGQAGFTERLTEMLRTAGTDEEGAPTFVEALGELGNAIDQREGTPGAEMKTLLDEWMALDKERDEQGMLTPEAVKRRAEITERLNKEVVPQVVAHRKQTQAARDDPSVPTMLRHPGGKAPEEDKGVVGKIVDKATEDAMSVKEAEKKGSPQVTEARKITGKVIIENLRSAYLELVNADGEDPESTPAAKTADTDVAAK
jgi:hypothetical protein